MPPLEGVPLRSSASDAKDVIAQPALGPEDGVEVETGPRRRAAVRLDDRQRAALRDSQTRGYLHLPYRDAREAHDRSAFGPLAEAWERACEAVGAATIVLESFADTGKSQVTFAARASPARTNPTPDQALAVQELGSLARPFRRESGGDAVAYPQLWWFTGPIPGEEAAELAQRAASLDRHFHRPGDLLVVEE